MKTEVKKKVVILIGVFIALGIIAIILSSIGKNNNSSLESFNDDSKFFAIQSTINSIIDDESKNYIVNKIICKNHNETDYCFIGGYLLEYPELSDLIYNNKVGYLLILKGNTYNIKEIETQNIEEYAKNYSEYEELKDGKMLDFIVYSEKNKISSYISNFINLTIFEPDKSYEYLTEKEKSKIGSEYDYERNISKYQSISSNIINYTKSGNIYTITDSNNNRFKVIEESTMNYKIEF